MSVTVRWWADRTAFEGLLVCKQRNKESTKNVPGDWEVLLPPDVYFLLTEEQST